jgi:WD40 repeat protein
MKVILNNSYQTEQSYAMKSLLQMWCAVVGLVLLGGEASQAADPQGMEAPRLVVQMAHSQLVSSVVFSTDGRTLASGSWDKTIKLWEVDTGRELYL